MQNANRRCTGHATMHAPFPTIAPNQESLSNCCMEALSHSSKMKNSGRYSPWNFTKNYCTYKCHTLRVYRPPKVLLRPLCQTFLRIPKQFFVFVSSPKKTNPHSLQQSSKHCGSIVQRTNCKVAFCFGAIARKSACTVVSRSFALSDDIVA